MPPVYSVRLLWPYLCPIIADGLHICNYKYCVFREVANEFGDPYLCYPSSCYYDEVWIPRFATEGGWKFKRTGTLATGAPVCDFRLERLLGGGEP